jgi:hypothetical protein
LAQLRLKLEGDLKRIYLKTQSWKLKRAYDYKKDKWI